MLVSDLVTCSPGHDHTFAAYQIHVATDYCRTNTEQPD